MKSNSAPFTNPFALIYFLNNARFIFPLSYPALSSNPIKATVLLICIHRSSAYLTLNAHFAGNKINATEHKTRHVRQTACPLGANRIQKK